MNTKYLNLIAITSLVALNTGIMPAALADTLTTVTTTTTEATPVSSYHYRRVITPVAIRPYEKTVTIQKAAVVKRVGATSCSKSNHLSSIHHVRHVASATRPRLIASSSTTKTITRTIEKPVYIDRVVEKPVYRDRLVEKPVVIEKPVLVRQSYVEAIPAAPVLVQEKVTHHSDHDTIKIKRYY